METAERQMDPLGEAVEGSDEELSARARTELTECSAMLRPTR